MTREDLFYICRTIGNLAGIPLRIYENEQQILYHSLIRLPADPIRLYEDDIHKRKEHVCYYATPEFDYYGIVNGDYCQVVIGPTRQVDSDERELRHMAFELGLPIDEWNLFADAMKMIVRFPLDSLLQMLCTLNYMVNGEKLQLSDITIAGIPAMKVESPDEDGKKEAEEEPAARSQQGEVYTAYQIEQTLMHMVEEGDVTGFVRWSREAPAIRSGILSKNQLRHFRNLCIVSTTLACRAAIRGGLSERRAFLMADSYIQRCELLTDPSDISSLQYEMILDFTDHVRRIRVGRVQTALSLAVADYIEEHITDTITVEEVAAALYLSRSRLSARLKEETGMTLTQMIHSIKTEEAKRLLLYSHKSVNAISDYLGFSSQSHLNHVFKVQTGMTPAGFRRQRGMDSLASQEYRDGQP